MTTKIENAGRGASLALVFAVLLASANAQQTEKMARVGFLYVSHAGGLAQRGIENSLRDLGYIAGKNILYESRYANWQSERLPELTDELLRQKVDVIVAITNITAFPAKKTTETVPIVVWGIHGAVATGLVRSLARPGGNVTGVESMAPELDAKRLHLIKEIVPKLTRLGVVYNPEDQGAPVHFESTREAARILGVRIVPLPVKRLDEFDRVLSDTAAGSIDALLTFSDPLTGWNWRKIAEFASKHRLPTVCEFRDLVEDGCLVSYGPSYDEFHGVVARQVDKILKGATPGDLPVEQVNRFEMLLNTKAAKALGITIPPSVLMKANEVVE